ncbi:MAG: gamma-glutamyltransferase [Gammaproteobacteria bacterium]
MNYRRKILILLALTIALPASPVSASPASEVAASERAPNKAAIASAHPLATAAGHEILQQGGNAFDAAVAVSAALSVVEPFSSGLGGGGFWLLLRAEDQHSVVIDGREVAPGQATADMYLDAQGQPVPRASLDGPLAAGIPGLPAALVHLARDYGRVPLAVSLAPAIRLADQGFPLYARMQLGLKYKQKLIRQWPAGADLFLVDGEVPEIGHLIRQPALARTFEMLATQGRDGFYAGDLAATMVREVRQAGGIWALEDLNSYKVVERAPIEFSYQGVRIVSAPPPSAGGVALADMFNILSGYDLESVDEATRVHLTVEAMRRAYRDRAEYLGDPDFVSVPVSQLTHPYYADGQRASIRRDKATPSSSLPGYRGDDADGQHTTHYSVLDADGNRVAATQTINGWFGSGYVIPGTGVLLNNEMDDFAIKPGVQNLYELVGASANAIAPGKRPLSSMSPTFAESDRGVIILGTPGGSRIITMVMLGLMTWMDGGDASEVAARPRYHHQYLPDHIYYEPDAIAAPVRGSLEAMGHSLRESSRLYGNMNVVTWEFETADVDAASDPRAEGGAEVRVY